MISAERREPADAAGDAGASPREEALWLYESLVPGTAVNNLSTAFAVAGGLDPARLEAALAAVVRHHAALRTTYRGDGTRLTRRVSAPEAFPVALARVVLPGGPPEHAAPDTDPVPVPHTDTGTAPGTDSAPAP